MTDQDGKPKPQSDEEFFSSLATCLRYIHTAKDEEHAEIAIDNALSRISSTMTRNSRARSSKEQFAIEALKGLGKFEQTRKVISPKMTTIYEEKFIPSRDIVGYIANLTKSQEES